MKKKTSWLLGGLCATIFSFACGFSFADKNSSAETLQNVQDAVARGTRVETVENWLEVTDSASITVAFDETQFSEGEFLAFDLKVEESFLDGAPNMYTPKLKINGEDVLDGDGKNFRFYNRNGNSYDVEYKFGGYLFLPKDANGILYIPSEDLITENGTLETVSTVTLEFSNHARSGKALYYSLFKASAFAEQASAENTVFDFSKVATNENGTVIDPWITSKNLVLTSSASKNAGYASYQNTAFTVTTPTDSFANTYFTASFPETAFVAGDYLAIDLAVKNATISGGASNNYAFQLKLNGATMQQPSGVYKQTFGTEFGAYQRSGSGVGYFGNGVWFFMNADLDAILYIPADKLLAGTSSANATLQTKLSSVTIDYASGNVGRQTTVCYNGIFKATAIGETMNESNCLYDFAKVNVNASGAVEDETLTVSRLIAKVEKTSETRFVADMVHSFDEETKYVTAKNDGEYALRLTPENVAVGDADALSISFRASRSIRENLKLSVLVKMQGDDNVYGLLDGANVPACYENKKKNYVAKNGYVFPDLGDDATLYLPLKFLTANGSAYLSDSIAEKFGADGKIDYIEIAYTGGDLALGCVTLLREGGGKSIKTSLGNSFSIVSGDAEILEEHYDSVALYVNGQRAEVKNGEATATVYGSVISVKEQLDLYAETRLGYLLRDGVQIVSVVTATDENGGNRAEWIGADGLTADGVLARIRHFESELPLAPRTVYMYVTLQGDRSYLVAPEKTVKNVNEAPVFEFAAQTEFGEAAVVDYEWRVDGEKRGVEASFTFAPETVGIYAVELYVNGELIGSRSVTVTDQEIKEFADGQILGAEYVTKNTGGFYVSTPDGWSSQDAYFSVNFDETAVNGRYLAIDLKVEGIVYGSTILSSQHQYTVRFGINGGTLSQQDSAVIQKFSAVNRAGNSVEVDFKFGNWFFIPENFNGVIYIPADALLSGSGLQETLSAFTVDYSGGNTQKFSTVAYNYVYLANEIGDGYEQGEILVDYRVLQAKNDGMVTDARFMVSGDLRVENTYKTQSFWTANVIELDDPFENAVKLGVKTEQLGGKAINEPYAFGWAEARVDAFKPHDGFAVQVYAPSGICYFKIILEDENGAFWKPEISSLSEKLNTSSFQLTYKEEVGSVKGGYGCFYLVDKQIGTLYVPYSALVPVTDGADFKGDRLAAGETLGKIVAVHFGLDMQYGLGRTLAVGTFADVDIENGELRYVFGTSFMEDRELNTQSPSLGAAFKSSCTAAHEKNWTWSRLIDREMPGYVNKDALNALVEFCNRLNKAEYTEVSWASFYGKLAVAKSVAGNPFATQKDVNDATSALSLAKFQLLRLTDAQAQTGGNGGCGGEISWRSGGVITVILTSVLIVLMKKKERA